MARRRKSRLARHQRKTLTRQAGLFLGLAVFLVVAVFKWGLPALIKLAIFLGDLRSSSQRVEQSDTIAPIPPRLAYLPEATYSASLTVKGFAEAGSTVMVYLNNSQKAEVVVDNEGEFVVEGVKLISGKNRIWAVARDQAGNESRESDEVLVVVDGDAPNLIVSAPEDGAETRDEVVAVKGTVSELEAEVRVNDRFVNVDGEGRFSTRISLSSGDNLIRVVARDEAGNETVKELTVKRQE